MVLHGDYFSISNFFQFFNFMRNKWTFIPWIFFNFYFPFESIAWRLTYPSALTTLKNCRNVLEMRSMQGPEWVPLLWKSYGGLNSKVLAPSCVVSRDRVREVYTGWAGSSCYCMSQFHWKM